MCRPVDQCTRIKYMSEKQGKLLAMMERKRNLISEAQEDLRIQIFQEIKDEKISGKEIELLEKEQILEEMLTERRSGAVEERRNTVVVVLLGRGFTRRAVAESRSSETEGDPPSVEERSRRKSKGTDKTVAVGCGVSRMTATGLGARSSEVDSDFFLCEVGGHPKDTEEEQSLWARSRCRRRKETHLFG